MGGACETNCMFPHIEYLEWLQGRPDVAMYDLGSSDLRGVTETQERPATVPPALEGRSDPPVGATLELQIAGEYGVDPECVLVTAGASHANFLATATALDADPTSERAEERQRALVEKPGYEPHRRTPAAFDAAVDRFLREDDYRLVPERVEKALTPNTSLVTLTNRHNPSGRLADRETLADVAAHASEYDARLLVDCGSGVLGALARAGVTPTSLDAVLLTHHHLDHVSDLLPVLKARWLADERAAALPVAGPPGTGDLLDGLLDVHDYLAGRVAVDARDHAPESFSLAGVDIETYETAHSASMRSFAYRLGDALTVSGDTPADPGLAAFADGTTLVHDCAHPDGAGGDAHATPAEVGAVLAGHDYPHVSLTHLYPTADARREDALAAVRERYDGAVSVAADGERLDLG